MYIEQNGLDEYHDKFVCVQQNYPAHTDCTRGASCREGKGNPRLRPPKFHCEDNSEMTANVHSSAPKRGKKHLHHNALLGGKPLPNAHVLSGFNTQSSMSSRHI